MYKSRIAVSLTNSKLDFWNGQVSKTQADISKHLHEASQTSASNRNDKIKVMEMKVPDNGDSAKKSNCKTMKLNLKSA